MSWKNFRDATPEDIHVAEEGLRCTNAYVDHLLDALKRHKEKHGLSCIAVCPGEHFIEDLTAFSSDVDGLDILQGIITVMTTRLAGYDTD